MEYDSYFLLTSRYLLILVGLWPEVKFHKFAYFIYSIFLQFYFVIFLVTFVIGCFLKLPSLSAAEQADHLTYVFIYLLTFWKICLVKKKSLKELINGVVLFEETLVDADPVLKTIYKKQSMANYRLNVSVPVISCPGFFLFMNGVISDYLKWKSLEAKGIPSGKHLLFLEWLPYLEEYFDFYYFYQISCAFVSTLFISCVDSLIISLISYTTARIKLLETEMENLFFIKQSLEETKLFLRKTVLKHKEIIRNIDDLKQNFKWLFFIDFTIKSYQVSLILWSFFDESLQLIPKHWIAFKTFEVIVILVQVSVLYFQANEVRFQSIKFGDSIYKSNWLGQSSEISNNLMIMMIRTKKPLTLDSFGIVTLDNTLLLKIYKAAYTYIVLNLSNINLYN